MYYTPSTTTTAGKKVEPSEHRISLSLSFGVTFIIEAVDINFVDDLFNSSTVNRFSCIGMFKLSDILNVLPGNPGSSHVRKFISVVVQLKITSPSGQTRFGASGTICWTFTT